MTVARPSYRLRPCRCHGWVGVRSLQQRQHGFWSTCGSRRSMSVLHTAGKPGWIAEYRAPRSGNPLRHFASAAPAKAWLRRTHLKFCRGGGW